MLFGLGERDRLGRIRRRLADETFYGRIFIETETPCGWFVVDSVFHNLSCHPEIHGHILSESFFHPGTAPGAAGQVVIDNCRSTERHARGSSKERAGRREERANPNYCQQEVLSRKNGASRKHHKIKQLQQIITAVRHQGKTKTVNISRFTFMTFFTVF